MTEERRDITGATQGDQAVQEFLSKVAATPAPRHAGRQGRLLFALDATASRQPTWDRACHLQGQMFEEALSLGGLQIQLVFYRGYRECKAGRWNDSADKLLRQMTAVSCLGGQTQIERVLGHAVKETGKLKVDALVFVGDAFEEAIDDVCHKAGELGLLGVPAFMFQEGDDPAATNAFKQIAQLTKGAHCQFDAGSAKQLAELLRAVAAFAAGGRKALLEYGDRTGGIVRQITHQVGGSQDGGSR